MNNNLPPTQKPRDESLDFVKFVAIILVIMVHFTAVAFAYPTGAWWYAATAYRGISSICVPMFFMTTGAMLLPRATSLKGTMMRISRAAVPLVLWSLVYLAWYQYGVHVKVGNWLLDILLNRSAAHLWFLYALIGAYIFLPLLSLFYINSTSGPKAVLIGAWFVGASLNQFARRLYGHPIIDIDLSYAPLWSGYMMMGAVTYEWMKEHRDAMWLMLSGVISAGTIYEIIVHTWKWLDVRHETTTLYFDYASPLVVVAAASSFVTLQLLFDRIRFAVVRVPVSMVSKRTFGIYLLHFLLLQFYFSYAEGNFMFIDMTGPWSWFPIACLIALIASTILVWGLQKIPLLRLLCPD
ncbi:acyltransferase [Paraburkholderia xenovorans]